MGPHLRRFERDEVVLTQDQAFQVLRFFWPDVSVNPGALTVEDRGFAQALLIEAIDASYRMGFVEAWFRSLAKMGSGLKAVIKAFGKAALEHWFKYATRTDIMDDPRIYEIVRLTVVRNFRTVWRLRESTGELIY